MSTTTLEQLKATHAKLAEQIAALERTTNHAAQAVTLVLPQAHIVEFSGVPAGHSSNHPAGGTSAGTQG